MAKNFIDLIFQLKSSCQAKEEKIRQDLNLSPAEFRGILAIIPGSEIPCNILAKKMGLSISRGSRVIDKLLNNSYLKGRKNEKDHRITTVTLSQKGVSVQKKIHQILEDCEHTILKSMDRNELKALENSLIKLSDILVSN